MIAAPADQESEILSEHFNEDRRRIIVAERHGRRILGDVDLGFVPHLADEFAHDLQRRRFILGFRAIERGFAHRWRRSATVSAGRIAALRWAIAGCASRSRLPASGVAAARIVATLTAVARHRLRCHPLGGYPHQRFRVLIRPGIGEHFDIDIVLAQIELLEREAYRFLNRIGLNLDAGHPLGCHRYRSLPPAALVRRGDRPRERSLTANRPRLS